MLGGRIKDGAAANRFAESLAEMAQAGVADFGRRFSYVIAAAPEQFRRALHPRVAQELRNGEANFPRKDPAQVKRTAAHFLPEHFERRRIDQIAHKELFCA